MSLKTSSFLTSLERIRETCLDMLFPLSCVGCGKYGYHLCEDCTARIPRRLHQRCPLCLRRTTPRGDTCFSCTSNEEIDGIFAGSLYTSPLVSSSIHILKYRFIKNISLPLGNWLGRRVIETDISLPHFCIPVPLHPRRLRFRGFNQSTLLAQALIDEMTPNLNTLLLENCLIRTRFTKPQMRTETKDERLHNLRNAFEVTKEGALLIQGKSIWLIDDVSTTGTTLLECAKVLKKAGAKNVFGIVLAR